MSHLTGASPGTLGFHEESIPESEPKALRRSVRVFLRRYEAEPHATWSGKPGADFFAEGFAVDRFAGELGLRGLHHHAHLFERGHAGLG